MTEQINKPKKKRVMCFPSSPSSDLNPIPKLSKDEFKRLALPKKRLTVRVKK